MSTRSFYTGAAFLCAVWFTVYPLTRCSAFSLYSKDWGNVVTVTDMTMAGKQFPPPSEGNPVYYVGHSLGCRLGSRAGEFMPEEKDMSDIMVKVLARQGYLGAKPEGPKPSLYLVLQWGCLQPERDNLYWFLGYEQLKDIGASNGAAMGMEVYWRHARTLLNQTIVAYAAEPLFGIIVTAFEYESAQTANPVILWQTRIGLRATAKSMAEALPQMALAAGPRIGIEADSAVLNHVRNPEVGHVEFGEIEVVDYEK